MGYLMARDCRYEATVTLVADGSKSLSFGDFDEFFCGGISVPVYGQGGSRLITASVQIRQERQQV